MKTKHNCFFGICLSIFLIGAAALAGCSTISRGVQDGNQTAEADVSGGFDSAGSEETPAAAEDSDAAESPAPGSVLNIYSWNDEFKNRFEAYYHGYNKATQMIGDVKVNWNILPPDNNVYQLSLDEALLNQPDSDSAEKVDLFLVEADYALKYVRGSRALSMADLGITNADMSEMFPYTQDVVRDADGIQRAASWQASSGVLIYRRDIAKEVLGSDDPDTVQRLLSDWNGFDAVAEKMSQKGYKMLSGADDTYRVFANNVSQPWVDSRMVIHIDPELTRWVQQAKEYTEKQYNNRNDLFSGAWQDDMRGNVFAYFGPAWFFDYTLASNSLAQKEADGGKREVGNGTYGRWGIVKGPESYFWGGTWICAAAGTDNRQLDADIIRRMCCSPETASSMARDVNEFANNRSIMKSIAGDSAFGSPLLGGQNPYPILYASAEAVKMKNLTPFDQGITESFQTAMHAYIRGDKTESEALDEFYASVQEKYPALKRE